MGSPDRNVSMVDIHLGKLLWVYCPGQAGVKRNGRADRLAGKATLTSGLLLENLKCWEVWDTTCRRKAKDIAPLITWRREVWKEEALDDLPWKDESGPSSIRRILEPFQRQCWGNCWETKQSTYGLFHAQRYHPELNWTVVVKIKHLQPSPAEHSGGDPGDM